MVVNSKCKQYDGMDVNSMMFARKFATWKICHRRQWRSKGASGARALGRRPWRRNSTLFAVILNVFLSRNLDQNMLKNAHFLGKNCKSGRLSVGGSAPRTPICLRRLGAPPPDPRVVTPAYYYNFIEFVSNVKCILFR